MRAEARFRPCSSPKAMSKGERPFLRRPNSGAAFDPKQKDAECCAGATPPPRIFQIRKRNPFAGRSRFNPEYAGNDMGKTLFAVVAAGGGVAMGPALWWAAPLPIHFLTFPSVPFAQCAGCGVDDNQAECQRIFLAPPLRGF